MDDFEAESVQLYIYDLTKGAAVIMSEMLLGRRIEGIWHTAVVVYGQEFFYGGQGIQRVQPVSKSNLWRPIDRFRQSVLYESLNSCVYSKKSRWKGRKQQNTEEFLLSENILVVGLYQIWTKRHHSKNRNSYTSVACIVSSEKFCRRKIDRGCVRLRSNWSFPSFLITTMKGKAVVVRLRSGYNKTKRKNI